MLNEHAHPARQYFPQSCILPVFLSSIGKNLLNNIEGLWSLFLSFYAVSLSVRYLCGYTLLGVLVGFPGTCACRCTERRDWWIFIQHGATGKLSITKDCICPVGVEELGWQKQGSELEMSGNVAGPPLHPSTIAACFHPTFRRTHWAYWSLFAQRQIRACVCEGHVCPAKLRFLTWCPLTQAPVTPRLGIMA